MFVSGSPILPSSSRCAHILANPFHDSLLEISLHWDTLPASVGTLCPWPCMLRAFCRLSVVVWAYYSLPLWNEHLASCLFSLQMMVLIIDTMVCPVHARLFAIFGLRNGTGCCEGDCVQSSWSRVTGQRICRRHEIGLVLGSLSFECLWKAPGTTVESNLQGATSQQIPHRWVSEQILQGVSSRHDSLAVFFWNANYYKCPLWLQEKMKVLRESLVQKNTNYSFIKSAQGNKQPVCELPQLSNYCSLLLKD